ncbi:hypothetical protein KJ885_04990 [Patescibacteria group bacterium]|nr:hypothetical protein [Patescibacteria group bacterium]
MRGVLVILVLGLICLGGCYESEPTQEELTRYKKVVENAHLTTIKDCSLYYYNPVTQKCYWMLMCYRFVSAAEAKCTKPVVDRLINKNEYPSANAEAQ